MNHFIYFITLAFLFYAGIKGIGNGNYLIGGAFVMFSFSTSIIYIWVESAHERRKAAKKQKNNVRGITDKGI